MKDTQKRKTKKNHNDSLNSIVRNSRYQNVMQHIRQPTQSNCFMRQYYKKDKFSQKKTKQKN